MIQRRSRRWPILVLFASGGCAFLAAAACSLTGPDAGPRTNGCISEGCFDSSTDPPADGSTTPGTDGSTASDSPTGFPNPIEGTSKAASLVKNGFGFIEGPVWIGGHLLFSDTMNNVIDQLSTDEQTVTPFRMNSGAANGNAVDAMGRMVTCEGGNRRVVRSAAGGAAPLNTLTGMFNGLPYNSPNDVIVRNDGNIYFTDPSYNEDPDAAAHQPKQGLFRIDAAGAVTRVKVYNSNPNGVAISPDNNILYVSDTTANVVNEWTLAADGTPSNEQKFADVNGGDGMAMDDAGNLYVAAATGVIVYDKTGTALGTITVAETPANCTFGGADRKTLYITARMGLYKIALKVPGLP